jgi:hypothetical protein
MMSVLLNNFITSLIKKINVINHFFNINLINHFNYFSFNKIMQVINQIFYIHTVIFLKNYLISNKKSNISD